MRPGLVLAACLAKYVACVRYWPLRPSERLSERVAGIEWVRLRRWDRYYYNPQEMFDRLLAIIGKKTRKYPTLHRLQALDELYLIVFYSKGMLWNPPYDAHGFGFREVADEVAGRLQDGGSFQKIFLFSPAERGQTIFQIWPRDTSPQVVLLSSSSGGRQTVAPGA